MSDAAAGQAHPAGATPWARTPPPSRPEGLARLAAEVRRDLDRLNHPPPDWPIPAIGPDGRRALDVLVVGGGMFGQTAAFALQREGVRNLRVIDAAPRGQEGPWGTYARMEILRSPKHLTGPDLGVPSLTFRAWYEAQHGAEGWEALYKIHRTEWRDHLLWLRDTLEIAVENDTRLVSLEPGSALARAVIEGPNGREVVHARQVVLATGREGGGGENLPVYPSLSAEAARAARGRTLFHSSDAIDFAALAGKRVAVLGASASAFDNAAVALESGASEVVMYSRRPIMPQVNKSRWMGFSGFLRHFPTFDDATRWRFLAYTTGLNTPPPHESVLRCERHPGFRIVFGETWRDVIPDADGVRLATSAGEMRFDAAIFATGFAVEIGRVPELAGFAQDVALWGDRVGEEQARAHPHLASFPYLDAGFGLVARDPARAAALGRVRLLNYAATMSHGALTGDIPGVSLGCQRVAQAIGRELFLEQADAHFKALVAFEEAELAPTRFYVPPDQRAGPRAG